MVTACPDVTGADIIPRLKELGYDYAELSLTHLCSLSNHAFNNLNQLLVESDISCEACNNFFPSTIPLVGKERNISQISDYLAIAFERAGFLGVKTIVFGSGNARMVPCGTTTDEATDQLVELLEKVNQHAIIHDIIIAIEPLRKQECNIVNTFTEALILAGKANCSNVKCLLDSFHLHEENEDISVIQLQPDMLAHVHFAEPAGRVFPIAANRNKYEQIFRVLKQVKYNSRLSLEAYSQNFNVDAMTGITILKEIESQLD
jgi:sugar phosphate isomerase/epimerase